MLDEFASRYHVTFKEESRFQGELAKVELENGRVYLLKPMTFMNLSGYAVKKCVQYYRIKLRDILVVTDDADLDFDTLKLKPKGSSGGHNGLKHIEGQLGPDYARLKMGIGSPARGELETYVLEKFSKSEEEVMGAFIEDGVDVIQSWIQNGLEIAMNQANS